MEMLSFSETLTSRLSQDHCINGESIVLKENQINEELEKLGRSRCPREMIDVNLIR